MSYAVVINAKFKNNIATTEKKTDRLRIDKNYFAQQFIY